MRALHKVLVELFLMAPQRHSFLSAKQTEQVFPYAVSHLALASTTSPDGITKNSNVRIYCHMAVQFECYRMSIIVGKQY
jgi:hypothetical protein